LQSKKIADQRKVVCAAPDYLTRNGSPRSPADLAQHEALVYWHSGQIYPWTFHGTNGQLIDANLTWRLQFDSHEAIVDAAVRGIGVACLPAWLIRDHLEAGRLMPLLEDSPSDRSETYIVWPVAQFYPLKLSVTIDALIERLRWVDTL
jgi:DNA-binding transcriptional LysR family regulator